MKILGIETSCDETAAAMLEFKHGPSQLDRSEVGGFKILSNIVSSSVELQAKYGGIVPEVAARKQMEMIMPVIEEALAGKKPDYIAVTNGPGLITSLRVGVEVARSLSYIWDKPIISVNHLEGHVYSVQLNRSQKLKVKSQKLLSIKFPALALIVSGGHTQLVLTKDYLKYKIIGATRDDAVGEAFDKVAKILGLGYPGGPIISKLAEQGNPSRIELPRPMIGSGDYDFSFSGIKTAVLYWARNQEIRKSRNQESKKSRKQEIRKSRKQKVDLCASFEQACIDVLVAKTVKATREYRVKTVILGGGVAANRNLRKQLGQAVLSKIPKVDFLASDIQFCGDNAVMIGLAGYYKIRAKGNSNWKKVNTDPNLNFIS